MAICHHNLKQLRMYVEQTQQLVYIHHIQIFVYKTSTGIQFPVYHPRAKASAGEDKKWPHSEPGKR